MLKKVGKSHYVASPQGGSPSQQLVAASSSSSYLAAPPPRLAFNRGYSTDGEESGRAGSERTMSEYMITNERASVVSTPSKRHHHHHHHHQPRRERHRSAPGGGGGRRQRSAGRERHHTDHEGSDIYVTSAAYRAPSEYSRGSRQSRPPSRAPSHYSYRSTAPSLVSTVKTRVDKKRGLVVETMSAPNPFCPNTKGLCCLMLLLNLGIVLVTLGFVIVIQFFKPFFVWILGIVFLVFGFLTLIGSLIYCVTVCRDVRSPREVAERGHAWTRHWQKNIGSPPEIHYRAEEKYHTDTDHYSVSEKQSMDRHSGRY